MERKAMSQQASSSATPTTHDRATFTDVTCKLDIGIKLLISHLDKAFDAGFELELEVGRDVMSAIIESQWLAKRLNEDIHTLGLEFDGPAPTRQRRPDEQHFPKPHA
jgi:hypothetical protein